MEPSREELRALEDSLVREVRRFKDIYIRPTSTGDISSSTTPKLHHGSSAVLAVADADDRPTLGNQRIARPHAPLQPYKPSRQAAGDTRAGKTSQVSSISDRRERRRGRRSNDQCSEQVSMQGQQSTDLPYDIARSREGLMKDASFERDGNTSRPTVAHNGRIRQPMSTHYFHLTGPAGGPTDEYMSQDIQFLNIDYDTQPSSLKSPRGKERHMHPERINQATNDELLGFESQQTEFDILSVANAKQSIAPELSPKQKGLTVKLLNASSASNSRASSAAENSRYRPGSRVGASRHVSTGEKRTYNDSDDDGIPVLPSGRRLLINILSTWGDPHYVGLMGLELFDSNGRAVHIPGKSIRADPADINDLDEYHGDPRTIDKLVDGNMLTCDDLHSWLAPFNQGRNHLISIDLDDHNEGKAVTLAMLRIWNYNKSRIHSNRGVRYIEASLDGKMIFKGEIKKAVGQADILQHSASCECVLFTADEKILSSVLLNDTINKKYEQALNDAEEAENYRAQELGSSRSHAALLERVPDAVPSYSTEPEGADLDSAKDGDYSQRPTTGQGLRQRSNFSSSSVHDDRSSGHHGLNKSLSTPVLRPSTANVARKQAPVQVQVVELGIVSSWGDRDMIGLTGIVAMDAALEEMLLPIPEVYIGVPLEVSDRNNKNMHVIKRTAYQPVQQGNSDVRVLVKPSHLNSSTTNPKDMWFVRNPAREHQSHFIVLRFELKKETHLKGLKLWNCNAGKDGAHCGIKHAHIYINGVRRMTNIVARKAPGVSVHFDYAQFLPLATRDKDKGAATTSIRGGGNTSGFRRHDSDHDIRSPILASADLRPSTENISPLKWDQPVDQNDDEADMERLLLENEGEQSFDDDDNDSDNIHGLNDSKATFASNFTFETAAQIQTYNSSTFDVCDLQQQYETPLHVHGCIIKFVLHSTHGDSNYIGLNSICMYDEAGTEIPISPDQIQGTPWRDVNDLEEIQRLGHDARCIENLVNGSPANTYNDRYLWLCPFVDPSERQQQKNTLLILMDTPVTVSCIKIWNYSKTPSRGVKELEIFVDDVLCYRGSLYASPSWDDLPEQASESAMGSDDSTIEWGGRTDPNLSQSILFTNDGRICERERKRIPQTVSDICFFDSGEVVKETLRSRTSSTAGTRPMTAVQGGRGR